MKHLNEKQINTVAEGAAGDGGADRRQSGLPDQEHLAAFKEVF